MVMRNRRLILRLLLSFHDVEIKCQSFFFPFFLLDFKVSKQCGFCPKCGKEKENQTKCQSCGIHFSKDLQRNCRQTVTLNDSAGLSLRTSTHQNSGGQKSQNTILPAKKFYGNSVGKIPIDIIVSCDESGQNYLHTNGKVILSRAKVAKITNLKERKTSLSDLNDPSKYFTLFSIAYMGLIFFTYIFNVSMSIFLKCSFKRFFVSLYDMLLG